MSPAPASEGGVDGVAVEHVRAEKVLFYVTAALSHHALHGLASAARIEEAESMLGYQLTQYLLRTFALGSKPEERVVEYPADWWQHFKQRWFPRWALRRWPVRNEREAIKVWGRLCPHIVTPNDMGPHYLFLADREPHPSPRAPGSGGA